MKRVLLYASILPAVVIFTLGLWLTHVGSAVYLVGRWLWREHDKYLRWLHWHLCGEACPHWGESDG